MDVIRTDLLCVGNKPPYEYIKVVFLLIIKGYHPRVNCHSL